MYLRSVAWWYLKQAPKHSLLLQHRWHYKFRSQIFYMEKLRPRKGKRLRWTLWTSWCSLIFINSHTWQTFIEYLLYVRPLPGTEKQGWLRYFPHLSDVQGQGKGWLPQSGLCCHSPLPSVMSLHPCIHSQTLLLISPCIHSSIHPSIHLLTYPPTSQPTYSSSHPSTPRLFVHLSPIHPSTHLPVHPSKQLCGQSFLWVKPLLSATVMCVPSMTSPITLVVMFSSLTYIPF